LAMPPRGIVAQRDVHESGVTARSYRLGRKGIPGNSREHLGVPGSWKTGQKSGQISSQVSPSGGLPPRGGQFPFDLALDILATRKLRHGSDEEIAGVRRGSQVERLDLLCHCILQRHSVLAP